MRRSLAVLFLSVVAVPFAFAACAEGDPRPVDSSPSPTTTTDKVEPTPAPTTTTPKPQSNPDDALAPAVTSVDPASATVGSVGPSITAFGDNFVPRSILQLDGAPLATTFVSATELRATIPTSKLAAVGLLRISVGTSPPGGGASREVIFAVTNPKPAVTSLAPLSVMVGAGATAVTVSGSGFVQGARIMFGGTDLVTTFVSTSQLTGAIPSAALAVAGSVPLTVMNPSPGGGGSPPFSFTIANPDAIVQGISPGAALVGSASTNLTVTGAGFVSGSAVVFNGQALATSFVSAGELRTTVPATALGAAGDFPVAIRNPPPGGGLSAPVAFRVQYPAPSASSLSPATVAAGSGPTDVVVTGVGFFITSQVFFDGAPAATTYLDGTRVRATLSAAQVAAAGPISVRVATPAPGGGTSSAVSFMVTNPAPSILGLNPPSVVAGSPDRTITITGSGFVPSSTVQSNGVSTMATYVSATQLTTVVPSTQLLYPGSVALTVTNPSPGGGTSVAKNLTVGCDTSGVDLPLGNIGTTTTLQTLFSNAASMARFQSAGSCTQVTLDATNVQPARSWIVQNTAGVPVTLSAWADCTASGKQDDAFLTFYKRPTLPANEAERLGCTNVVSEGLNGPGGYASPDRGISEWCPGLTKANGGGLVLGVCEKAVVHVQPYNATSATYPPPPVVKVRPE
jgi:hypothetical protein